MEIFYMCAKIENLSVRSIRALFEAEETRGAGNPAGKFLAPIAIYSYASHIHCRWTLIGNFGEDFPLRFD
jgi:hypothetical protein